MRQEGQQQRRRGGDEVHPCHFSGARRWSSGERTGWTSWAKKASRSGRLGGSGERTLYAQVPQRAAAWVLTEKNAVPAQAPTQRGCCLSRRTPIPQCRGQAAGGGGALAPLLGLWACTASFAPLHAPSRPTCFPV